MVKKRLSGDFWPKKPIFHPKYNASGGFPLDQSAPGYFTL
jgi:hypothetical protein